MKTRFFTLILATCIFSNQSYAKIFRVGYTGPQLTGVDYSFGTALANANSGDTIQIYGSVSNGNNTISKKLIILGFGYNLDAHPNLQLNSVDAPSSIDGIFFGPGSDGSVIKGISSPSFQCGDYYGTGTPMGDITFERCYGGFYFFHRPGYGLLSNVRIISCAGSFVQMYDGANGVPVKNIQIYNSVFTQYFFYNTETTVSIINCIGINHTYNQSILNLSDAQVLVKNCIIGSIIGNIDNNTNTDYENNFFQDVQPTTLPPGSNNHWGVIMNDFFNIADQYDQHRNPNSANDFDENYLVLSANSPAKGAGLNNANQPTDCGIFGGEPAYKYVMGGIPPVPAVYQLTSSGQAATSNPYNITISVRSNN